MESNFFNSLGGALFDGSNLSLRILLKKQAEDASQRRGNYIESLANAKGDDVFRHFLLVNVSALDAYLAQSRLQAQSSFRLCKIVAYLAFLIIAFGVALAIFGSAIGNDRYLSAAQLTGYSGILTQFISGIFFYLYNKTLQQFTLSQEKLLGTEEVAIALVANGSIGDLKTRDATTAVLARELLEKGASRIGKDSSNQGDDKSASFKASKNLQKGSADQKGDGSSI